MATQYLKRICIALACCIALYACRKDGALSSSPDTNTFYTLPQGSHPYDTAIVSFYKKYNSFILYRFDSVDYNYNITGPVFSGLYMSPADTGDIAQALDYLQTNLFNLYPENFLQKTMPFKILLASHIFISSDGHGQSGLAAGTYYYNAYAGANYMAFGVVNDSLKTLSGHQLDSTRGLLQMACWQQATGNGNIARPPGFDTLTNYTAMAQFGNNNPNRNKYGVFFTTSPRGLYDAAGDFLAYIDIITSTDEETMKNTWLSPAYDVNGLYNAKYKLITGYYKENYGVDLQAIGNLKNP